MDDLDKLIGGIENCLTGAPCALCPYREKLMGYKISECQKAIRYDTLNFLKRQKPRVLSIKEVEDALDTVVFVEIAGTINDSDNYAYIESYSRKDGWVGLIRVRESTATQHLYRLYGATWRCWNIRPSDEQRKARAWDGL